MTLQDILSAAQKQFPKVNLEIQKGDVGDEWLLVQSTDLLPLMQYFYKDLTMDFLSCLSGVDYQTHFAVVYHLRSLQKKFEIMVKAVLDRDKPVVASVSELWADAGWFEREIYDLLGIHFNGHKDLRRLMMPADWIGHPLRKDYQEPAEYHGIPTTRPDAHRLLDRQFPKKATEGIEDSN